MLFVCDRAKDVWEAVGLGDIVGAAASRDRSGAAALEELLCSDLLGGVELPGYNAIEVIMVAYWFIWWEQRKVAHDEKLEDQGDHC